MATYKKEQEEVKEPSVTVITKTKKNGKVIRKTKARGAGIKDRATRREVDYDGNGTYEKTTIRGTKTGKSRIKENDDVNTVKEETPTKEAPKLKEAVEPSKNTESTTPSKKKSSGTGKGSTKKESEDASSSKENSTSKEEEKKPESRFKRWAKSKLEYAKEHPLETALDVAGTASMFIPGVGLVGGAIKAGRLAAKGYKVAKAAKGVAKIAKGTSELSNVGKGAKLAQETANLVEKGNKVKKVEAAVTKSGEKVKDLKKASDVAKDKLVKEADNYQKVKNANPVTKTKKQLKKELDKATKESTKASSKSSQPHRLKKELDAEEQAINAKWDAKASSKTGKHKGTLNKAEQKLKQKELDNVSKRRSKVEAYEKSAKHKNNVKAGRDAAKKVKSVKGEIRSYEASAKKVKPAKAEYNRKANIYQKASKAHTQAQKGNNDAKKKLTSVAAERDAARTTAKTTLNDVKNKKTINELSTQAHDKVSKSGKGFWDKQKSHYKIMRDTRSAKGKLSVGETAKAAGKGTWNHMKSTKGKRQLKWIGAGMTGKMAANALHSYNNFDETEEKKKFGGSSKSLMKGMKGIKSAKNTKKSCIKSRKK